MSNNTGWYLLTAEDVEKLNTYVEKNNMAHEDLNGIKYEMHDLYIHEDWFDEYIGGI